MSVSNTCDKLGGTDVSVNDLYKIGLSIDFILFTVANRSLLLLTVSVSLSIKCNSYNSRFTKINCM